MLKSGKIKVGQRKITAITMKLGDKNLVVLSGRKGFIMCGYLNMAVANKFGDIAIKITGVSTIKDALFAKVHSASNTAKRLGIKKGQPIKDVLKVIA